MNELITEMLSFIEIKEIKINKTTVTYQGVNTSHGEFLKEIAQSLSDNSALTVLRSQPNEVMTSLKKTIGKEIFSGISSGTSIESSLYAPLIPVQDFRTGDRKLVNVNGTLSEANYKGWYDLLDADTRKTVNSAMVLSITDYNPYKEDMGDIEIGENRVKVINKYKKPTWLVSLPWGQREGAGELPEEIQKFLGHLFTKQQDLDYVLDWMYYAITSRMEVALVLNGAKGVGKGIFGTILQQLVGPDNHKKARVNMLDTNFNSDFRYNQIMEFDEIKITPTRVNHLKLYFNDDLSIEVKGVDGAIKMQNHNSFYISANGAGDLHLESDDRRFSVIKVTDEPLLEIMEDGEVNELISKLTTMDGEMISQIGKYILHRGAKLDYGRIKAYKTERFYELVENSLTGWQKYLFKQINEKNIDMKLSRVRSKYNQNHSKYPMPEADTPILDFLRNYRDVKGDRIADLVDGVIIVGNSSDEDFL